MNDKNMILSKNMTPSVVPHFGTQLWNKPMLLIKRLAATLTFGVIVAFALALLPLSAFADAGGDPPPALKLKKKSNSSKTAKRNFFTIKCIKGKAWDRKKRKCIAEEKSSSLDQNEIFNRGRELALATLYQDAIGVLALAPDQSDPRVLNIIGFANRKMGNMPKAFEYYHAAIASDPEFPLVREYLGEAYVEIGQLEKARQQLSQLERICGNQTCGEYMKLANVIIDSQLD